MAQPIKISVTVLPPVTNDIVKMLDDPNKVMVTIVNTSGQDYYLKFHLTLTGDNGIWARTKENYTPSDAFKIGGFESKTVSLDQLEGFGNENDFEYEGFDKNQLIRTRKIPEGNYTFCVEAFDFNAPGKTAPLSSGFPAGCAHNIMLATFDPPQVVSVGNGTCGSRLTPTEPQLINIIWLPPAGANRLIRYKIQMVEMYPANREPNDALFSNAGPLFLEEETQGNVFNLNSTHQQLKPGAKYAFRVQALDPDNETTFRNNGYSQVCWFTYGSEPEFSNANFSLNVLFPSAGDTLPFLNPPVIYTWSPYHNAVSELNHSLRIETNNIPLSSFNRNFSFTPDLLNYAKNKNSNRTPTHEDIQRVIVAPDPSFPSGRVKGRRYDIEINSEFALNNTPLKQTIVEQTGYTFGMPKPILTSPENNAVLDEGNITFRFNTCSHCNTPFSAQPLLNLETSARIYDYSDHIRINETMVLEVATSNAFTNVVASQIVRFNMEVPVTQLSRVYDSLFRSFQFTIPDLAGGIYYWRVKFLSDPASDSINTPAYITSAVYKLHVGRYIQDESSPCASSNCESQPLPADRQVAASGLRPGRTLQMGEFNLVVSSVSDSGGTTYSGEGIILINPFPNGSGANLYPVKVSFSNIQFNRFNQIFAGSAATINSGQSNAWNAVTAATYPSGTDLEGLRLTLQTAQTVLPVSTPNSSGNGVNTPFVIPVLKHAFEYNFTVLGIAFTPTSARMNCAMELDGIKEDKHYTFMASQLCLKARGWASELVEMNLLQDISFRFFDSEVFIEGYKNDRSNTKAVWDCNGFKHIHLEGNVQFSRNIIKPSGEGNNLSENKVVGYFATNIVSLNDVLYRVVINEPYRITHLGKSAEIRSPEIIIDRSETTNPSGLTAPAYYNGSIDNRWNGVFIPSLQVTLDLFPDNPVMATNFFYDGAFTGRITGSNVFSINTGVLGNMNVSLDSIDVLIVQDDVRTYLLQGQVNPRLNETLRLNYEMNVDYPDVNGDSEVHGRIIMNENTPVNIPSLYSTLTIFRNSNLTFNKEVNDAYRPVLTLNGLLSVNGEFEQVGVVELPQMRIEGMVLRLNPRAGEKFFEKPVFSFTSPQKNIGGFPVNITSIEEIYNAQTRLFGFNFIYNLALGQNAGAFGVTGNLAIKANARVNNNLLNLSFNGISFDSLKIQGNISVVSVDGSLYFFRNNTTYGNGLTGSVSARFEPGVDVFAQAYFGQVKHGTTTHNYWGVYGGASFAEALPMFGVMECKGFAGGVYYNMKLNETQGNVNVRRVIEPSSSGLDVLLIPHINTVGFSAKIWLQSAGGGESYKTLSTIGAEFNNSSWSLNRIYLTGNMWLMPDGQSDVPVWADLNIDFDWERRILSGQFNAYLQNNGIEGTGPGYRAGYINMFVSSNKWYVYVGTPTDRIGITVPALGADLGAYLCIGSVVPGVPELPETIRNVLSATQLGNYRNRSNTATGSGFAFGAFFSFNPPPSSFLIFKGDLNLMLGFDLSLIKYNGNVSCDGANQRSSLGFNNWYAQGQLYAYVYASLSIHVDVWFAEGNFNIFRGEAGVALAGGLPNPTWASGAIAGKYRILGGSIKGRFSYEFNIGTVCRPTQLADNPVVDLKIIEQVNLSNNSRNVSPFSAFTSALNFKPNQAFTIELTDNNGQDYTRTFRAQVAPQLKQGNSIWVIDQSLASEADGEEDFYYLLTVSPRNALNPNMEYQLLLNAHFEEKINNVWSVARTKNGQEVRQNVRVNFTTGNLPQRIPQSIISAQCPLPWENYFKVNTRISATQVATGRQFSLKFISQVRNAYFYDSASHIAPHLITGEPSVGKVAVKYVLRVTNLNNSSSADYELTVLSNEIKLLNALSTILQNNTKYKLAVIRKKVLPSGAVNTAIAGRDGIAADVQSQLVSGNARYSLEKRTLRFSGNGAAFSQQIDDDEFTLYELYVKTSKFNSLFDKLDQLSLISNQRDNSSRTINFNFNSSERFDAKELENEIQVLDIYEGSKLYFSRSGKQYDVYEMLTQKAQGTFYETFISKPASFYIGTQTNYPNLNALTNPVSGFSEPTAFVNQPAEPAISQVVFYSPYELYVSLDRPKIQAYCANYIALLAATSTSQSYYNQVRLTPAERSQVQSILNISWPKRAGSEIDGTYVPDPNRYNIRFLLRKPDGSTGAVKNFFYQLN